MSEARGRNEQYPEAVDGPYSHGQDLLMSRCPQRRTKGHCIRGRRETPKPRCQNKVIGGGSIIGVI